MEIDELLKQSSQNIDVPSLQFNKEVKHQKNSLKKPIIWSVVAVLILLISFVAVKGAKFSSYLKYNGIFATKPLSYTDITIATFKNLYEIKYDEKDILKKIVYTTDREVETNVDLFLHLKKRVFDGDEEIKINNDKETIICVLYEVNIHFIKDVWHNETLNVTKKVLIKPPYYIENNKKVFDVNNIHSIVVSSYSYDDSKFNYEIVGNVSNNVINLQASFFESGNGNFLFDISILTNEFTKEDNYYHISYNEFSPLFASFYDLINNKIKVNYKTYSFSLIPKKSNESFKYLINSYEELMGLGYTESEFAKYDEAYFNDNILIIIEKNLDHEYGACHGSMDVIDVYLKHTTLFVECDVMKSYNLVYSYRKICVVEIPLSEISSYEIFYPTISYNRNEDLRDARFYNIGSKSISFKKYEGEVIENNFSGKIDGDNVIVTGFCTTLVKFMFLEKVDDQLIVYYNLDENNGYNYSVEGTLFCDSEFLDGIKSITFALQEE